MTSSNQNIFCVTGLCVGNSPVTSEFPSQRPVTWSFDVFCDLHLNKQLSEQSKCCWLEMPSCSLWCHCNVCVQACHLRGYRDIYARVPKIFQFIQPFSRTYTSYIMQFWPLNNVFCLLLYIHTPYLVTGYETYIMFYGCMCVWTCLLQSFPQFWHSLYLYKRVFECT